MDSVALAARNSLLSIGVINRAYEECRLSTFRTHMGAVVFKGKKILSSGHNGIRHSSLDPRYILYSHALHAEQAALIGLDWKKLSRCSILVLRISKAQEILGNAKPCPMCLRLIQTVGIKNIYYSDENSQIVRMEL